MFPNSAANSHFLGAMSISVFLFAAVSGCASDSSLVQRAYKLHSYTPCGMVMNAMMPHSQNHADGTTETGTGLQVTPESQAVGEDVGHAAH
jgi:hypothetical protein